MGTCYLFLRNDYLSGQRVLGVWNGMVDQADATNHFALLANAIWHVSGIAIDLARQTTVSCKSKQIRRYGTYLLAFGDFVARAHSDYFSGFAKDELVDRLVQHVSASVNCR